MHMHAYGWPGYTCMWVYVDVALAPTKHCIRCMHCPSDCLASLCLPTDDRKCNRSESCERTSNGQQKVDKSCNWKSVSGEPLSAIATCFWKIERAVWSSGNIPFTVLTSFNLKVVIAERVTLESQKKKKSVQPRSREQSTAYSEVSFELGSSLSLQ